VLQSVEFTCIKESVNINSGPSTETFLHYDKELWTGNSHQENYWNTDNVDNKIITIEKLKEALKKMEYYQAKIT
jgi:hypothetical protein